MSKLKICCISDTHQHHRKVIVPECDLIIHAGDFTYHGDDDEVDKFLNWFEELPIKHKIVVCGNHEKGISTNYPAFEQKCRDRCIISLRNEHAIIEGFTIFGSPYSVKFGPWAYGMEDKDLADIWNMASPDTDIFISHGPPKNILDNCRGGNVGSQTLADRIEKELHNLKLCVFGHIHENGGQIVFKNEVLYVNAAICGIPYSDVKFNPVTVTIETNNDYIIYGLRDPRNQEIRYVGKSCSGLNRPHSHTNKSELNKKCKKSSWIKSLIKENLVPEIVTLEKLKSDTRLDEREIFWISQYSNLTNMTSGGTGGNTGGGEKRRVPIICKNILTNEETEYCSITSTKEDGFSPTMVVSICKHKKLKYKNFTFKYKDGNYPPYNVAKSRGKSIYRGVSTSSIAGKWRSTISHKGKQIIIGYYENEIDAAIAYNKKSIELNGNLAKLNVIIEKK
jgi:Icc-related predicted phosphoesterase